LSCSSEVKAISAATLSHSAKAVSHSDKRQ
jgi:hypothetical protein